MTAETPRHDSIRAGLIARGVRLRLALVVLSVLPMAVLAQVRYRDVYFGSYNESFNIQYGQVGTNRLYLDYWEPAGDTASNRAAMVWVHGGGFTGGDKSQEDYRTWSRTLARHGYVSVSINYRLSTDYTGNIGQQDARAAVRWLRANAESLRIDTSRIAIGGGSAGSIISMAVAYWEGPEGDSGNPGHSSEVAAVIDMWGWLHPVTEMQAGEAPIAIIHGTADTTVSFNEATAIHTQADAVGVPHTWHPIQGGPHWSYPTVTANFSWVTDFLYDYVILVSNSALVRPAAPGNLSALPVSSTQVNLVWADNATNESAYRVERSLDSNSWVLATLAAANATNGIDTGLATNTLHYYRVAASNAAGLSGYAYASATTWTGYEAWQHAYFSAAQLTNAAVSGNSADPDRDGMNNEQEYRAGTDPTNALSALGFDQYEIDNLKSGIMIRWQSATGRLYTVQAATNLVVGFTNMILHVSATPPVNVYTDSVSGVGCRFYRVEVE